jgi:hypothetical protein
VAPHGSWVTLDEAQNRLAEALNRLERLEADPRADVLAVRRARITVGVWRRKVRLLAREPFQRVLPLR